MLARSVVTRLLILPVMDLDLPEPESFFFEDDFLSSPLGLFPPFFDDSGDCAFVGEDLAEETLSGSALTLILNECSNTNCVSNASKWTFNRSTMRRYHSIERATVMGLRNKMMTQNQGRMSASEEGEVSVSEEEEKLVSR